MEASKFPERRVSRFHRAASFPRWLGLSAAGALLLSLAVPVTEASAATSTQKVTVPATQPWTDTAQHGSAGVKLAAVQPRNSAQASFPGLAVDVAYADNDPTHPAGGAFPSPWDGSPNVIFEGCTGGCSFDSGAILIKNLSSSTMTIAHVTASIGASCTFDIWPSNMSLPAGQALILAQTASGDSFGCPGDGTFDTSDVINYPECNHDGTVPVVRVTIGTTTASYLDTGQVLNTGGIDPGGCGNGSNESEQWVPIGQASGPPAAPTNLAAKPVNASSIRLTWTDNSSNESGFEINNGVTSQNAAANATSYTWGGLAPNTYMCFRIRAFNSAGDSSWDPNVSPYYVCTTTPAAQPYYALGDSYSAGEGVPPIITTNGCRQSQSGAYPSLFAAKTKNYKLSAFVACSGAVINDVAGTQASAIKSGSALVTLTVGGNDAGFAKVLQDCIFNDCTVVDSNEGNVINGLLGPLYNAYLKIKAKASKLQILVLTYPQIFTTNVPPCAGISGITAKEESWIRARTSQLNGIIKKAAASAGVQVLDEENAFKGHELCTGAPGASGSWVNGEQFTDTHWWFHPNKYGQQKLAADLLARVG